MKSVWKRPNQALWRPHSATACSAGAGEADQMHLSETLVCSETNHGLFFGEWKSKVTKKNVLHFSAAYWRSNLMKTTKMISTSYLWEFWATAFFGGGGGGRGGRVWVNFLQNERKHLEMRVVRCRQKPTQLQTSPRARDILEQTEINS